MTSFDSMQTWAARVDFSEGELYVTSLDAVAFLVWENRKS